MNPIAERCWQPLPRTYYYVDYSQKDGASIKQVESFSGFCGAAAIATTPLAAAERTLELLVVEAHLDAQGARGADYTLETWAAELEELFEEIAALELLIARLKTQEPVDNCKVEKSDAPVAG